MPIGPAGRQPGSNADLRSKSCMANVKAMAEPVHQGPFVDAVEVDAPTLAAIDRGIRAADEGRTVSIDEVRKMIPKWISKFESQKPR